MKDIKFFWPILVLVLQVPVVITLFQVMPSKKIAGVLGAIIFASVIFWLLSHFHGKLAMKSLAIYTLMLQLFLFVIPILAIRLSHWGMKFEDIVVFGFRAQLLHSFSEKFFVLILWASIYDCFKIRRQSKQGAEDESNAVV